MGTRELHKKGAESHSERYSIRLKESTRNRIAKLTDAGWDMPEYVRAAVEEAVDEAYREKIGTGGEARVMELKIPETAEGKINEVQSFAKPGSRA